MRKKIYIIGMIAMLSVAAAGCGKKTSEDSTTAAATETDATETEISPKEDFLNFVNNEIPAIEDKKNTAVEIYNSYYSTDGVNLEDYEKKLNGEAVPAMKEYIEALNAIETSTEEVASLKQLFIESAQKQYEAMQIVSKAIADENTASLTDADVCISEAKDYSDEYISEILRLAEKYGINVIESASATDATVTDAAE